MKQMNKFINEKFRLRDDTTISEFDPDKINKRDFIKWFIEEAPVNFYLKCATDQDGFRGFNLYDEADKLVGSYDENDGFEPGSAY